MIFSLIESFKNSNKMSSFALIILFIIGLRFRNKPVIFQFNTQYEQGFQNYYGRNFKKLVQEDEPKFFIKIAGYFLPNSRPPKKNQIAHLLRY